jgi:hypothetical protein
MHKLNPQFWGLNVFKFGIINSFVLSKFEAIFNIFWYVTHSITKLFYRLYVVIIFI